MLVDCEQIIVQFCDDKNRLNWPKTSIRLNIPLLILFVSSFSALELLSGAIFALNKLASTSSVFCLVRAVSFVHTETHRCFLSVSNHLSLIPQFVFLVLPSLGRTSIVLQDTLLELSLAWPKRFWLVSSKRFESISYWEPSSSSSDSLTGMISSELQQVQSRFFLTVHCSNSITRGGRVLRRILDTGVPRRFVNPNPI